MWMRPPAWLALFHPGLIGVENAQRPFLQVMSQLAQFAIQGAAQFFSLSRNRHPMHLSSATLPLCAGDGFDPREAVQLSM